MNILLVDDDRFIIKALQETIHKPSPSHHSKPPNRPHDQ